MITPGHVVALVLLVSPITAAAVTLQFNDSDGKPLPDVVVMLPGYSPADTSRRNMVQRNRSFDPHVLVVGKHSEVSFPNQDNTLHHVYSFSPAKIFSIELYEGVPEAPVLFDKLGIVELGCNIHDQMQAFIVVTDTGGVFQSNTDGQVQLPSDANTATLLFWHPRLQDNQHWVEYNAAGNGDTIVLDTEAARQSTPHRLDRLQRRLREL
ncbi:MAG: methylamine utilization protein [Marinobacter sp.]|nr:methylamine utilization protein [Marinobacter sp.]